MDYNYIKNLNTFLDFEVFLNVFIVPCLLHGAHYLLFKMSGQIFVANKNVSSKFVLTNNVSANVESLNVRQVKIN